jgi:phosphatidylglycerophosphatase A
MSLVSLLRCCSVCVASGFGSGYARIAPGTCGSLVALGAWWLLLQSHVLASSGGVALLVVTAVLGCVAVAFSIEPSSGDSDPSWIVIDEWAGLFVALIGIAPQEWHLLVCAFVLFRFFDATKVGPVGWAESLPGCWGIMADDLVAGVCTALVIAAVR